MAAPQNKLFPAIGQVVDETDKAEELKPANDVTSADEERAVQEIESLCMKCYQQGVTRMLLTSIPFFREVIVMSFRCEHCGFQNNEIQSAGQIRPEGVVYTARILARKDLDRQIVKSETCTVIIPDFELTIPPNRGQLTTVEGLLRDIATDLSENQPFRRIDNEAAYNKIETILEGIRAILADNDDELEDKATVGAVKVNSAVDKDAPMKPFVITIDDPAGNSFLEFVGSMADPKWNMRTYRRTRQHNIELGLVDASAEPEPERQEVDENIGGGLEGQNEEIYVFHGTCSSCGHPSDTLVKKVNIPYFKDILIMSINCDLCGFRDNEVKSGSAISERGKRITLKVEGREDLSRDILKSESSGLEIPEIDLVLKEGTLGGRFTTLEGILNQIYEELSEKLFNDSKSDGAFETFLAKLKAVKSAEHPFTLILDDPLANSYLQNLYAPDPDPNMTIEEYDRTFDQNEDLGLNDMKVEGYENDPNVDAIAKGETS
ncbi:zf-ZPR1-domain-containing protein [Cytidiella melzeri]|nr:zf-ZPR1-domain-containing protein [Cytidiella melzeri]